VDVEHAAIIGDRMWARTRQPKKCQPLSMVTLTMSKFSLVGVETRRVKFGTLDQCRAGRKARWSAVMTNLILIYAIVRYSVGVGGRTQ